MNIVKGPSKRKKNFVSHFAEILCVRPFDAKDFKIWGFFQKKKFKIFFQFLPMLKDPQKISTSKISIFFEKDF